jgi:hypothetical protein
MKPNRYREKEDNGKDLSERGMEGQGEERKEKGKKRHLVANG